MGGGGGDGGYTDRQNKIDADKKAARSALNALFGVYTDPGTVDRSAFERITYGAGPLDESGNASGSTTTFDQAGYDAAVAAATQGRQDEAAKAKAELEALYGASRTNAYTAGKTRIDEQKGQADRNLKFELFARGQNGGSGEIDQKALLGREYTQGITDLGAKADDVANSLRDSNEQTRLQLLQSIDSGMDQSSALSSALGQMKVNSDKAASAATSTALDDLFTSGALIYNQNRVSQGKQNAANWWASNSPTSSGSRSSRSGILTAS